MKRGVELLQVDEEGDVVVDEKSGTSNRLLTNTKDSKVSRKEKGLAGLGASVPGKFKAAIRQTCKTM